MPATAPHRDILRRVGGAPCQGRPGGIPLWNVVDPLRWSIPAYELGSNKFARRPSVELPLLGMYPYCRIPARFNNSFTYNPKEMYRLLPKGKGGESGFTNTYCDPYQLTIVPAMQEQLHHDKLEGHMMDVTSANAHGLPHADGVDFPFHAPLSEWLNSEQIAKIKREFDCAQDVKYFYQLFSQRSFSSSLCMFCFVSKMSKMS